MARSWTCESCGDSVVSGVLINGSLVCHPCLAEQEANQLDTPSLQDSDPEGWGAAHNVNPWGMDGGY